MAWKYVFGIDKVESPEFEEVKIDEIAAWIMRQIDDSQSATAYKTMCNAYSQASQDEDWSSKEPRAFTFLQATNAENVRVNCSIEVGINEDGDHEGAVIRGVVEVYSKGLDITANLVTLETQYIPETVRETIKEGVMVDKIINTPVIRGRKIEIEQDCYKIHLNPVEPKPWYEEMTEEYGW